MANSIHSINESDSGNEPSSVVTNKYISDEISTTYAQHLITDSERNSENLSIQFKKPPLNQSSKERARESAGKSIRKFRKWATQNEDRKIVFQFCIIADELPETLANSEFF